MSVRDLATTSTAGSGIAGWLLCVCITGFGR
jgi:hypothetical protein